ncbi:MAG: AAA family ATPase [Synergistaceae bacterium]|jgi:DNA repair protein RecN (Recombination protein N)|nr:AAA family ATPase [Synergistaceae bacterium]
MIARLEVRGMGGVEKAALDFSGNFIAITGESGAGKSSLVRAFEFISGKRAQAAFINAGFEETEVTALWDEADGEILTRRSMSRSGKGRAWIGDSLATAGMLASRAEGRIGIQSQFAQLNLLDAAKQMELVDQCGGRELTACTERLGELFPQMMAVEKEIFEIKRRRAELEKKLEGAPERVRRVKSLGITPGCETEWERELASLERAEAEAGKYDDITARMNGDENGPGLLDQLTVFLRELYSIAPHDRADEWRELGEDGLSKLQELFESSRRELGLSSREEIASALEKCEARLGLVRKLKRETGSSTVEALLEYAAETEAEAKWLSESLAELEEKNSLSSRQRAEVASCAKELRLMRTRAAEDFGARVNRNLRDLGMDDAVFSVAVNRFDKVRATGAEGVSFMLSQKSGAPSPVGKVASGGELSRILIAIQASMDQSRLPESLVFDEVEAGLGGRTALLAGKKLRELSRGCRTILITHEATIAAMADQHFVVERHDDITEVREVAGEERVAEIARMLAGSESREAMEHARSLLGM